MQLECRSVLAAAALLVFFIAAAGAGIVSSDLGFGSADGARFQTFGINEPPFPVFLLEEALFVVVVDLIVRFVLCVKGDCPLFVSG